MLEVSSLSIFSTAKAFKRSLFMTDLRYYVFNLLRVEKDFSEEQFVAGVYKNIICPHISKSSLYILYKFSANLKTSDSDIVVRLKKGIF
jgi:hypothetical protein